MRKVEAADQGGRAGCPGHGAALGVSGRKITTSVMSQGHAGQSSPTAPIGSTAARSAHATFRISHWFSSAAISRLLRSSIIMWPFPRMP